MERKRKSVSLFTYALAFLPGVALVLLVAGLSGAPPVSRGGAPVLGPDVKSGKDAPAPDSSRSEAELRIPVQEMIARVDQVLRVPVGLLTGRLSVVTRTGDAAVWEFSLYKKNLRVRDIAETVLLYQFSSKRRGLEAKVLYREDGEVVWLWDAVRRQLFRKRDLEKFQGVLGTSFTFLDLAGSGYQAGYSGRSVRLVQAEGTRLARLSMVPINPGRYSRLVLLANPQERYRPLRIDYHDRDRVLFKTLNFQYGELLDRKSGGTGGATLPTRLEMLDLKNGMISRIEYFTLDVSVAPQDAFFDPEFLNR